MQIHKMVTEDFETFYAIHEVFQNQVAFDNPPLENNTTHVDVPHEHEI